MTARWRARRSDIVPVCPRLPAGYRCDLSRIPRVGFTCCKVSLVLITLREVLSLDVVRRGLPVVVAGADRLETPVRWVHAVEVTDDVARLLRGGELVLSTGIALPESDTALAFYVAELAAAGGAGLAIELGRRYVSSLPAALVAAAASSRVVLIEFRREVAFVEITEAVHTR